MELCVSSYHCCFPKREKLGRATVSQWTKKKNLKQCFLKVVIQIFKYSISCQLILFYPTLTIWTDSYETQFDPDTICFPILT